ncbi:hypothetical protein TIFTF001_030990 [Ficus carica]|uniref:Uncharacterized protein n=1 Tax=Ficus carica TaxID=3494 RepID=A0AA88DU23_FICCA|nr:hypothetical protein TIFTF001_030990 [Ficus carica]
MDEQDNQDFQDINNPALTGSQGTQRPQRGRRARAHRKPTQTEILAENVRSLTEMVRALVYTRRDANVIQFLEESPEAAESTPSRPRRSGSRPHNPQLRATGGVIGRIARASGSSSRRGQNRAGCDQGAVTPRLPAREQPSRQ